MSENNGIELNSKITDALEAILSNHESVSGARTMVDLSKGLGDNNTSWNNLGKKLQQMIVDGKNVANERLATQYTALSAYELEARKVGGLDSGEYDRAISRNKQLNALLRQDIMQGDSGKELRKPIEKEISGNETIIEKYEAAREDIPSIDFPIRTSINSDEGTQYLVLPIFQDTENSAASEIRDTFYDYVIKTILGSNYADDVEFLEREESSLVGIRVGDWHPSGRTLLQMIGTGLSDIMDKHKLKLCTTKVDSYCVDTARERGKEFENLTYLGAFCKTRIEELGSPSLNKLIENAGFGDSEYQTLSKILRKKSIPRAGSVEKLAKILSVPEEEFNKYM